MRLERFKHHGMTSGYARSKFSREKPQWIKKEHLVFALMLYAFITLTTQMQTMMNIQNRTLRLELRTGDKSVLDKQMNLNSILSIEEMENELGFNITEIEYLRPLALKEKENETNPRHIPN